MDTFWFGAVFVLGCVAIVVMMFMGGTKIEEWVRDVNVAVQRIGWRAEDYKELVGRIEEIERRIEKVERGEENV